MIIKYIIKIIKLVIIIKNNSTIIIKILKLIIINIIYKIIIIITLNKNQYNNINLMNKQF